MGEERKIFTLTQLNRSFENHIIKHFSQRYIWITAELIRINIKSGHHYVELADSVSNITTARASAVIWASTYRVLQEKIALRELNGILQPGNRILMNVKIEYHAVYGMKLKIRDIDPAYSYGEIERKRQEVIKRLKKENLFDLQQKIHLPPIVKRIALIGSPNTSGFRDFLNELFNNHEYNKFILKEFPVSVQGENAKRGIVKAIQEANLYDVEVIVLIRGGGSKMDLALFDDYQIAKAICESKLPVLIGIGHETDEVVADLVAKQHFITPTKVGQHFQFAVKSFKEIMRQYHDKIMKESIQQLGEKKEEFHHLNSYLSLYSKEIIQFWKNKFQEKGFEVVEKSKKLVYLSRDELLDISHQMSSRFLQLVNSEEFELNRLLENIQNNAQRNIEKEQENITNQFLDKIELFSIQLLEKERIIFQNQAELLQLLNPMKILSAGYTISTIEDKDIQNVEIKVGAEMKTLSSNTLIKSKIESIEPIKNEE